MNSTKIDLRSEEQRIELELEQIQADLSAVRRLILRHEVQETLELKVTGNDTIISPKRIGLTVAITGFFKDFPDKEWSPSDLRDWLLELRRRGELYSKAKSLLTATHTVIRKLEGQKKIVVCRTQVEPKPRKWYKWNDGK